MLASIFDFSDRLFPAFEKPSAFLKRASRIIRKGKRRMTSRNIFDLTGRVAVITGGNGGIGLGIAQALNAAGCGVSIWGRNAEKNASAAASMAAGPGKVATQ